MRVEGKGGRVFEGERVVVTVPMGVLKANVIEFVPPLPEWKQKAIERVGLAWMDKLFLEFDEVFWKKEDYRMVFFNSPEKKGRWIYTHSLLPFIGKPVLMLMNHGQSCLDLADKSDEEVIEDALGDLKVMFGKEAVEQRTVKSYVRTNWSKDPYIRSTWGYVNVDG